MDCNPIIIFVTWIPLKRDTFSDIGLLVPLVMTALILLEARKLAAIGCYKWLFLQGSEGLEPTISGL